LLNRLYDLKDLRLHVFGHIHESNGVLVRDPVTFVNAAICDRRRYAPVQPIHVIEL
jgi:Icc-related predicted phosphoesterase